MMFYMSGWFRSIGVLLSAVTVTYGLHSNQ